MRSVITVIFTIFTLIAVVIIIRFFATQSLVDTGEADGVSPADTVAVSSIGTALPANELNKSTFNLPGKSNVHTVRNFVRSGFVRIGDGIYFYDGSEQVPRQNFDITFDAGLSSFVIEITASNTNELNTAAGYELASMLDVRPNIVCDLNVFVTTTNADGDENLGLDICK